MKAIRILFCILVASAVLLSSSAVASADEGEDPNVGAVNDEGAPTVTAFPGQILAGFPGPLDSYSINLMIINNTNQPIWLFTLNGRYAHHGPLIWDSMGTFAGPATLRHLKGVDTQSVMAVFSGFDPGETVTFTGIDPDFIGDPSSGVRVGEIAGSLSFARGFGLGFARYQIMGNNVIAIIE